MEKTSRCETAEVGRPTERVSRDSSCRGPHILRTYLPGLGLAGRPVGVRRGPKEIRE